MSRQGSWVEGIRGIHLEYLEDWEWKNSGSKCHLHRDFVVLLPAEGDARLARRSLGNRPVEWTNCKDCWIPEASWCRQLLRH